MDKSILDKRLIYVTGKGGVGKTTVSAALGLAAAATGRRVIVCEVSEERRLARAFAPDAPMHREIDLGDGLWITSIDPRAALEQWLVHQLNSPVLARTLSRAQAFEYFIAAAPGVKELVTVGRMWELSQPERYERNADPYDLVIVDAPASGHGIAMLRTPSTFSSIARVGPVNRHAARIRNALADSEHTGFLAVTLAQEMPIAETIELDGQLRETFARGFDGVVVNRVGPSRFDEFEAARIREVAASSWGAGTRARVTAALAEHERSQTEAAHIKRLASATGGIPVELPAVDSTGAEAFRRLEPVLTSSLGLERRRDSPPAV